LAKSYQLMALCTRGTADAAAAVTAALGLTRVESGGLVALWQQSKSRSMLQSADRHALKTLISFQKGLEQLQMAGPILPGKFGTLMPDPASVAPVLDAFQDSIIRNILDFGHLRQYQLTVRWPTEAVLQLYSDGAGPAPHGGSKAEVAAHIAKILDVGRAALDGKLSDIVGPHLADRIDLPVDGPETGFCCVVLVDPAHENSFEAALDTLDTALPYEASIALAGPLPACSFASVTLDAVDTDVVKDAEAALTISGNYGRDAIQKAFVKTAYAAHPDQAGQTGPDARPMLDDGDDSGDINRLKHYRNMLIQVAIARAAGAEYVLTYHQDTGVGSRTGGGPA